MEPICLDDSDEDEVFASLPGGTNRGMCVSCGLVAKPHLCPHGGKLMKLPRREAVEEKEKQEGYVQQQQLGKRKTMHTTAPHATGAAAFLQSLLTEHSQMQTDADRLVRNEAVARTALGVQAKRTADAEENAAKHQLENKRLKTAEAAANVEVTRLQAEVAKRDKMIEQQKKASGKKKAAPNAVAAGKTGVETMMLSLIDDITQQYSKKASDIQKKLPPPPAPVAPPAPAPAPALPAPPMTVQVLQQNTAYQYKTVREVAFLDAASAPGGVAGFYFDNSSGPTPWSPVWTHITDSNVINAISALGAAISDASGIISWTPHVGTSCSYTFGQHTYNTTVVHQAAPVAPPPPPAPAAPPPPTAPAWQDDVLYKGKFYKITNAGIDAMLASGDFDAPDTIKMGSQAVADFAELISSFGQGFKYDASKCELWVKPLWMKVWLTAARTRKFTEARVLMHGMRTNEYDKLGKDMSGFDMNFSRDGRLRFGFYASASDHIASDYNGGVGKYPDGTFNIGLLWIKATALQGAYEHYHLGSHRHAPASAVHDAYAVRDQLLWLPIGLAVAQAHTG